MADGITVDDSELRAYARDLGEVNSIAGRYIRSAVEVSARKVKDYWRDDVDDIKGAAAFPFSIGYGIKTFHGFGVSVIQAEIGPDKDRNQGALGNLVEFEGEKDGGLSSNEGAGEAALERVEDDFVKGLAIALADAEHAAGVDSSVVRSAGAVMRGSYR